MSTRKAQPLSLYKATQQAEKLMLKNNCDYYVVGKRSMGDYHIVVMSERDFFPFTKLKTSDKFHDILRVKRFKFQGWTRDNHQCGLDKYYPANTGA